MAKSVQRVGNWIYGLLLVPAVLGIGAWQGWAWWSWVSAPVLTEVVANQPTEIEIEVSPGTGSQQIGNDLQAAGVIRSSTAWRIWYQVLKFQDKQGDFQSGTYTVSPQDSLPTIAQKIWRGTIVETSYTIPEGWSRQQMAEYFEAQGFFSAADFIQASNKIPRDKFPWLPEDLPHLEGFLYPDTYQLSKDGITPEKVVEQMLAQFQTVALPIYEQGQTQLSFLEWVKLASIVEKEAVIAKERPIIAGIFLERLRRGMNLETDPTVEYGLGIKQTADQPLTLTQVKTPNPYNTYMNPGLPPTAIASPGLASLQATLKPEQTEYLFFVARYDGSHVFSKTYEEHDTAALAIRQQRDGAESSPNPQSSPSPNPSTSPQSNPPASPQ